MWNIQLLFMLNISTCQLGFVSFPCHFQFNTHLELRGRFELVELGLWSDCFLEALEEDPLELHDLLDVAEKCVDLSVAQEGLFLHGFQVVLQQAVQMLVLVGMEEKKKERIGS